MRELEHYNKWLLEHKSIDLTDIYEDYKIELKQTVKTLDDVLEYLCVLSDITKFQLLTDYGKGKRGGSNKIPRVRGYLVKAVLSTDIEEFNSQNVYKKLFNIIKDHSTALHFKSYTEFFGKELEIYNKILNYIKTYDIQWEP
jgi:hypothetical protein